MTAPRLSRGPDVYTHPLWGLACVLGDIALRLDRRRAEELTGACPETRSGTASPTGREDGEP